KADVVLIKNDRSPVMFPLINPYGHVAFQAQRADVHTVMVNGKVVKHEHERVGIDLGAARREVESTVDYLRGALGEEAWAKGMNADVPDTNLLHHPHEHTHHAVRDTPPRQPVPVHRLLVGSHPRPLSTAPERGRHRRVPVPTGVARSTSGGA